jgi:hypothetical protein
VTPRADPLAAAGCVAVDPLRLDGVDGAFSAR